MLKIFGGALLVIAFLSIFIIFLNILGVLHIKNFVGLWIIFGVCFLVGVAALAVKE